MKHLSSWRTDTSKRTVDLDELIPGCPHKDCIPAIDAPTFVDSAGADRYNWLTDRSPLALLRHEGEAKAYPLQILNRHEIVNDFLAGLPIAMTFCPLCNTALAFVRQVGSEVLDFGVSGFLRHSDLVMYDRHSESWWQQATGEAIVGRFAGERLEILSAPVLNWADIKQEAPEARILSEQTGYSFDYSRGMPGYDRREGPKEQFFPWPVDRRLPAMERVVALDLENGVAVPFSQLRTLPAIPFEAAGRPLVALWAPGTASLLDSERVADGRDVGSTAVYQRQLGSVELSFRPIGDGRFASAEGTVWSLAGRGVSGPLVGSRLHSVPHSDAFWFAWASFRPDTRIETIPRA